MPSIVPGIPSAPGSPYATDVELAAHNADTTSIHGIADTSVLVTTAVADADYVHQVRSPVNVLDFGATGDGVTDDTDAIQDAIDALPAEGGTVLFPAGTYYVPISGNLPALVVPAVPVVLAGFARGASTIVTEATGTASGTLINQLVGSHLTVDRLAFTGPTAGTGYTYTGVIVNSADAAGSGDLTVRDCEFTGFTFQLRGGGGTTATITVQNCVLDGNVTASGLYCTPILCTSPDAGTVSVSDTVIRDYGQSATNQYHGAYVTVAMQVLFDRVRFSAQVGTGYGVTHYGGSGSASGTYRDCTFAADTVRGFYTGDGFSRVAGCDFLGTASTTEAAITAHADTLVEGCRFASLGPVFSAAATMRVQGCWFENPASSGYSIRRLAGATLYVSDCVFEDTFTNSVENPSSGTGYWANVYFTNYREAGAAASPPGEGWVSI